MTEFTKTKWSWKMACILVTVALFTSSCGFPFRRTSAGTKTPQTPQASQTSPDSAVKVFMNEVLPPVLVETDPPEGSHIGLNQAITLYFSKAMDHASTESAVTLDPAVEVRFDWLDEATLQIQPQIGFPEGQMLGVSLAETAKDADGKPLLHAYTLNYSLGGALRVTDRLPKPGTAEVDPSSALILTFSDPVVPLGASPDSLSPGFTLQPAASGSGEWVNTSTYVFRPDPPLSSGTTYSVEIQPGLRSLLGGALDLSGLDPALWDFTTSFPQVVKVDMGEAVPLLLDQEITITFNQPMQTEAAQENVRILTAGQIPIPLERKWDESGTILKLLPQPLYERSTRYTLEILTGMTSLNGTALRATERRSFQTTGPLLVDTSVENFGSPFLAGEGFGSFSIKFTAPLDPDQPFEDLIQIDPAPSSLNFSLYQRDTFFVDGAFYPSRSYAVQIDAALRDIWGGEMPRTANLVMVSNPAQPGMTLISSISSGNQVFLPFGESKVGMMTTNIRQINTALLPIEFDRYLELAEYRLDAVTVDFGSAEYGSQFLPVAEDISQQVEIPVSARGALPSGLYLLRLESPQLASEWDRGQYFILISSQVNLLIKTGEQKALIWALDLESRLPVQNLDVSILDREGQPAGECTTGADGICSVEISGKIEPYSTFYAVSGKPGEPTFGVASTAMSYGIAPWSFDLIQGTGRMETSAYVYTDRPIYRPGQTVNVKAIVRTDQNTRYVVPPLGEVELRVMSPFEPWQPEAEVLTTLRLPVNEFGTAVGEFRLPDSAIPGSYWISVPGLEGASGVTFQVADYRKPQYELQVELDQPGVQEGDTLTGRVRAAYYFGVPAGNLRLSWTLARQNDWHILPDGWHTGLADTEWMFYGGFTPGEYAFFVAQGNGVTNAQGEFEFSIPIKGLESLGLDRQTLIFEVSAADESDLPVTASARTVYHPSSFYIALKPDRWDSQVGRETGFNIQTIDWLDQPSGNHDLRASFQKMEWKQIRSVGVWNAWRYEKISSGPINADVRTDGLGRARVAFTPEAPGVYELTVEGEGAKSSRMIWVSGGSSAQWPQIKEQHLFVEADAASYKPGETARLRFQNPFAEGGLALITVERMGVMDSQIVAVEGSMVEWSLPIEEIHAPNVYVSITMVNGDTNQPAEFRQGYINLPVEPGALRLNIEAQANAERVKPGEEITIRVHIADSQGKPVEGEFSLALVDKALLALAEPNSKPIEGWYYGNQPLGVRSGLTLANSSQRVNPVKPGMGGGGDGGPALVLLTRSNFKDTAWWRGDVRTNAAGDAELRVKLPDNLTTWVADVRALDDQTRVGTAEFEVVATQDLLIRPQTPRFLTAGDRVWLGAIAQNNSDQPIQAVVELSASGITLDPSTPAAQTVEIPANGRVRLDWWALVEEVEQVDPVFRVSGGGRQDATRLENGPLPVLRNTAPAVFATTGVLSEQGETVEVLALPRTFNPQGGMLHLELSPSLTAVLIQGVKAQKSWPEEGTEQVVSALFANLAAGRALDKLTLNSPELGSQLRGEIIGQIRCLLRAQNNDGGFGLGSQDQNSQIHLSAYALIALQEAQEQKFLTTRDATDRLHQFLLSRLPVVTPESADWQYDELAFLSWVSARYQQPADPSVGFALEDLTPNRNRLGVWALALLAETQQITNPENAAVKELVSQVETSALRSATGVSWAVSDRAWYTWATPRYATAIITSVLARLDPANPLLTDAVRYLVLTRRANGGWTSSYESAWVLFALSEALTASGDLQADFRYEAELNGTVIASGNPSTPETALTPVVVTIPIAELAQEGGNELRIRREAGSGRLYYRAFLEVFRPALDMPASQKGISIAREYFAADEKCENGTCERINSVQLGGFEAVSVRLTLTVPEDLYDVRIEDFFPAGMEALDPNLLTSKRLEILPEDADQPEYDHTMPFNPSSGMSFGWWFFSPPRFGDEGVSWKADYLPAGVYQLVYRLIPTHAGTFQVLPARANAIYFPEIQGTSAGAVFTIEPE